MNQLGTVTSLRSLLFIPGNRTTWVSKAVDAGADAVILDLEDAVPAGAKADARAEVAEFLRDEPPIPVLVRINGLHDRTALDDLRAVVGRALTGVMVPKVESVADVQLVDRLVGWLESDERAGVTRIVPVLETAAGIRRAFDLASASPRIAYMGGIATKGGDVERSLGYRWTTDGTETLALRAQTLVDVRAAGVANPVTGMWADVRDLHGLATFAEQSRGLGYEGMLAIHPSHIDVIHKAFTPTEAELHRDAALVAAMEAGAAAGRGAVVHDGQMIDEAMAATARRRLSRYRGGES